MMTEMQVGIIQNFQSTIYSQIEELALTITTQVKISIQEAISQVLSMTIPNQHIVMEQENEIELITQESQPTNEEITGMKIEKEPRKRKEIPTQRL